MEDLLSHNCDLWMEKSVMRCKEDRQRIHFGLHLSVHFQGHSFLTLQKGLYWLQPPAVKLNRGHQFKIGPGDQSFNCRHGPTSPWRVVTDATPLAVKTWCVFLVMSPGIRILFGKCKSCFSGVLSEP
jgi:hypothetical protein